jgi:hypothetical protein
MFTTPALVLSLLVCIICLLTFGEYWDKRRSRVTYREVSLGTLTDGGWLAAPALDGKKVALTGKANGGLPFSIPAVSFYLVIHYTGDWPRDHYPVAVILPAGQPIPYERDVIRVVGTLHVNPDDDAPRFQRYRLDADYAGADRPSTLAVLLRRAENSLATLLLAIPAFFLAGATWKSLLRSLPPSNPGLCETCGYNLTGNISGICPECGAAVVRSAATEPPSA